MSPLRSRAGEAERGGPPLPAAVLTQQHKKTDRQPLGRKAVLTGSSSKVNYVSQSRL